MNNQVFRQKEASQSRQIDLRLKYKRLFNRSAVACPLFGVLAFVLAILSQEVATHQRLFVLCFCLAYVSFLAFLGKLIYYSYKRDE